MRVSIPESWLSRLRRALLATSVPQGKIRATIERSGAVRFDVAGWLTSEEGQQQLRECAAFWRRYQGIPEQVALPVATSIIEH